MEAVEKHLCGDAAGAANCLAKADDDRVFAYTVRAWGKGAADRYQFREVPNSPPHLAADDRPKPRMPKAEARRVVIRRDGYHCRFCGIPVVDAAVRRAISITYPDVVRWGSTNRAQHAAFQCMWLQFDHLLPNSRGGESCSKNVVVTCAPCNFGRMEATLEEARLLNPLTLDPPVVWKRYREWTGFENFRLPGKVCSTGS